MKGRSRHWKSIFPRYDSDRLLGRGSPILESNFPMKCRSSYILEAVLERFMVVVEIGMRFSYEK